MYIFLKQFLGKNQCNRNLQSEPFVFWVKTQHWVPAKTWFSLWRFRSIYWINISEQSSCTLSGSVCIPDNLWNGWQFIHGNNQQACTLTCQQSCCRYRGSGCDWCDGWCVEPHMIFHDGLIHWVVQAVMWVCACNGIQLLPCQNASLTIQLLTLIFSIMSTSCDLSECFCFKKRNKCMHTHIHTQFPSPPPPQKLLAIP